MDQQQTIEIGLRKSQFNVNDVRIRFLRRKENLRWELLGIREVNNGWHCTEIYTLDQAQELGIDFRTNWRELPKDKETKYFAPNICYFDNDWVVTEMSGPLGEFWVMRTLWYNITRTFPYLRTPTGSYAIRGKQKVFDGSDLRGQHSAGGYQDYQQPNSRITPRENLLITFITNLIIENGYYSKNVVNLAYKSTYSCRPTWQKVALIMRSEKIMGNVAKQLSEHLKDKNLDVNWVFEQLKEMGENDYAKSPERRLDVVKLVGSMNGLPTYREEATQLNKSEEFLMIESNREEDEEAKELLQKVG